MPTAISPYPQMTMLDTETTNRGELVSGLATSSATGIDLELTQIVSLVGKVDGIVESNTGRQTRTEFYVSLRG